MSKSSAHHKAVTARESGDLAEALRQDSIAMIDYSEANDPKGFAESLADRSLTLRHLYQKSGDKNYLTAAKAEMIASVEIALSSNDKTAMAIPFFNLAKVYEELGDSENSIKYFKNAVNSMEENPPETHNRPAVLADFRIHLSTAQLKNGDKSARQRLEQELHNLEQAEEDSYNKNVWLTGAHMNLADLLFNDDIDEARKHLAQAKKIIDSDDRLVLRKEQWNKLAEKFN